MTQPQKPAYSAPIGAGVTRGVGCRLRCAGEHADAAKYAITVQLTELCLRSTDFRITNRRPLTPVLSSGAQGEVPMTRLVSQSVAAFFSALAAIASAAGVAQAQGSN